MEHRQAQPAGDLSGDIEVKHLSAPSGSPSRQMVAQQLAGSLADPQDLPVIDAREADKKVLDR